jgi:hypothetical protein
MRLLILISLCLGLSINSANAQTCNYTTTEEIVSAHKAGNLKLPLCEANAWGMFQRCVHESDGKISPAKDGFANSCCDHLTKDWATKYRVCGLGAFNNEERAAFYFNCMKKGYDAVSNDCCDHLTKDLARRLNVCPTDHVKKLIGKAKHEAEKIQKRARDKLNDPEFQKQMLLLGIAAG